MTATNLIYILQTSTDNVHWDFHSLWNDSNNARTTIDSLKNKGFIVQIFGTQPMDA